MYGLLMALVPSMKSGRAMSAVVQLRGSGVRTIEVTCDGESLRSAEVPAGTAMIAGALPAVVDALAGRGDPVADALPGAPAELGFLAAFFNS
jgi:ribonuclease PH